MGAVCSLVDDKVILKCDFHQKNAAKAIPGRRWNPENKAWEYPARPEVLKQIKDIFPMVRVDGALAEMIADIEQNELQVSQAKALGWERAVPVEPMPIKVNPFKHQIMGFNIGIQLTAAALLMEMGCGKSLTAVAIAGRRFQKGQVKRVFIFCPSAVIPVWPREFADYADFPFEVKALEGTGAKRKKVLAEWKPNPQVLQVAVLNYEASWRMEEEILRWGPDMIICDESQRIKTPGTRQSKCLHSLGKKAKYKLILTGTPVSNTPLDFFSQYKFLDPSVFGQSFYVFRNRYAIMGGFENRQVVAYQNKDELIQKAHSVAFRVTKAEALDLPEFTDQYLYCDLEPYAQQIYRELERECVAALSEEKTLTAPQVITRLLRFSQITGGFLGDDEKEIHQVSKAKLSLLEETVEDLLESGKKAVIFARFIPEITAIQKLLQGQKVDYGLIYGDIPQKVRGEEVKRFQSDQSCRVFLAQIRTAGLGITLTAADTSIFYSTDYSFANYDQCRGRIHRIGQKNACTYIHLVARDTIDQKIIDALAAKRDIAADVVDNWKNYLRGN